MHCERSLAAEFSYSFGILCFGIYITQCSFSSSFFVSSPLADGSETLLTKVHSHILPSLPIRTSLLPLWLFSNGPRSSFVLFPLAVSRPFFACSWLPAFLPRPSFSADLHKKSPSRHIEDTILDALCVS
ncbi:hypothetical protein BDZ89DRAFT_577629 [Hymenopellis radicata]|nr:hypothetical protein BDZ89DRAFT_577629 [Hymenopellis radicata]